VPAFTANVTSGSVPLTVYFTDQSTYTPTHWSWYFGDGGTSNEQHPTHTYISAGTYTVTLYATNFEGTDIEMKTGYITAVNAYSGGSGIVSDPYLLSTDSDIDNLSVNHADWNKSFRLTQNITLEGTHTPIGDGEVPFTGNFDGNGFAVKNLTVYWTHSSAGFFGYTGSGADIYDLGIEAGPDGVVSTSSYAGVLVGYIESGNISNCYATGTATGTAYVGGLVGYIESGNVSNSSATGDVALSSSGASGVGGLVGYNYGTVINCSATGNVALSGPWASYVGGLVGYNYGTVINCSTTGDVTLNGFDTYGVGGLVGQNSGTLSHSYATGTVTGTELVGGFVGRNYGNVSNCYANSDAIGNSYVGGLVGYNFGNVSNCFATGNATSNNNYAGGLVGYIHSGNLSNCFATGNANGNLYVGGLVGHNNTGSVNNCYYSGTPGDSYGTPTSYDSFISFTFVSGDMGLDWNAGGNIITTEENSSFIWRIDNGSSLPYFQYQSTTIESDPVDSVSSSSPGSGRRASISYSQPPEIVKSTHTSVKHIMGGSSVEYDLSDTGSPVLAVSFDAKDNEGLVVAKVQVLSSTPEGIPSLPDNSYQLMSIDVGSQGTISSHNADNILIRFKVSREWIRENNIDPSTIRMTRYHDDQWNDLPTYQEREEDDYIYFYAETTGFSIFSVVGDKFVLATQNANDIPPVFTEGTEVPATSEDKKTPGFSVLLGLAFAFLAVVVNRKNRH
jgi:PGF-pre-PGF domain-containing protein